MNLFSWFGRSKAASPSLANEPAKPSEVVEKADTWAEYFDACRVMNAEQEAVFKKMPPYRISRTPGLLWTCERRTRVYVPTIPPPYWRPLTASDARVGFIPSYEPFGTPFRTRAAASRWLKAQLAQPADAIAFNKDGTPARLDGARTPKQVTGKARAKRSRPNQKPAEGEG